MTSLASLPPLRARRAGALRGAGYRKSPSFPVPEGQMASEPNRHAVREAAVAAAAAQKALVVEKQLDLKRRADAAAARGGGGGGGDRRRRRRRGPGGCRDPGAQAPLHGRAEGHTCRA